MLRRAIAAADVNPFAWGTLSLRCDASHMFVNVSTPTDRPNSPAAIVGTIFRICLTDVYKL